jgi:flavodoxin
LLLNKEEELMKALVAYHSESGNTEKLAKAIYESITAPDKKIATIADADPSGYDVIFVGFPVQASTVPGKVESFIKRIPEGKMLAFFVTHGSLRGGQLAITALYYAFSLALNRTVLGSFGCRGEVKAGIIESLLKSPEHKAWAMEAQSAAGHPDDADLADGKQFAELMIAKARNL